jgi:hypothetical protein
MKIVKGLSSNNDSLVAISEATSTWNESPNIIFLFCSVKYDSTIVLNYLRGAFPNSQIAGCTTSGELLDEKHLNGGLVVTGIHSPNTQWKVAVIENLKSLEKSHVSNVGNSLLKDLGTSLEELTQDNSFFITLIDGLSGKEEKVAEFAAEFFEGIPMLGGSAGDDLGFSKTSVFANGKTFSNSAVVVLAKTTQKFQIIKHQHFLKSSESIVITKADPENRVVYEINGYPAREGLSRVMNMNKSDLTGDTAFLKPLAFVSQGDMYVRSVQKINDDDSITFYCAIEEGMVLHLLNHSKMTSALSEDMNTISKSNKFSLMIGFNCILRSLEAASSKHYEELGSILSKHTSTFVGFDTYGEQLNGLHINQTLVGIAFKESA